MVEYKKKHFYIFEPVQLKNSQITIPIFFHTKNGQLFAKCYTPIIKSNSNHSTIEIHVTTKPTQMSFDEETLETFSVDEFSLIYNEIKLKNGLMLSDCCHNKIIGEKLHLNKMIENVHILILFLYFFGG
jgi:hypothetical protein